MGTQFYLNTAAEGLYEDLLSSESLGRDDGNYVFANPVSSEYENLFIEDDKFFMSSTSLSSADNQTFQLDVLENNKLLLQNSQEFSAPQAAGFIEIDEPRFIVGNNMDDKEGSTETYAVGDGSGVITGGNSNDQLVGDYGGSTLEGQVQNYNVVFVLDVSGSMSATSVTGESRMELMVRSVNELMADFSGFQGGEIKVHITAFDRQLDSSGTFTVTDTTGFQDAVDFMNALQEGGYTNYESGLQNAVEWLQSGEAIDNATTTTYFLSDGFPNYSIDDATGDYIYTGSSSMDHILGIDGTDEVSQLQDLSDEVIGVGISVGDSIANIQLIDSDGNALNVPADQLVAMMQETNPMTKLASVGDDVINGNEGDDIIFGDALYTDMLAADHGLDVDPGAGWEVFEMLESGQSGVNPDWDRQDTLSYLMSNAEQLSAETVTDEGVARIGGKDVLNGGEGNDLIFGQEGDDLIIGSEGNDILYGGSGADTFFYDAVQDRIDSIMDFDAAEGDVLDLSELLTVYDPLQDSIDDFVFMFEQNGNTRVFVDISGIDPVTSFTEVTSLQGVTGLDVTDMVNNGSLIVE